MDRKDEIGSIDSDKTNDCFKEIKNQLLDVSSDLQDIGMLLKTRDKILENSGEILDINIKKLRKIIKMMDI